MRAAELSAPIGDSPWPIGKTGSSNAGESSGSQSHAASEIRFHVGQPVWDSYYEFCFERNPWDRVISQYFWRDRLRPGQTMPGFSPRMGRHCCGAAATRCIRSTTGNVRWNRICRHEQPAEELKCHKRGSASPTLALPWQFWLCDSRTDKRRYIEILRRIGKGEARGVVPRGNRPPSDTRSDAHAVTAGGATTGPLATSTLCIPAAVADSMPSGVSSNTRQRAGSTPSRRAASR